MNIMELLIMINDRVAVDIELNNNIRNDVRDILIDDIKNDLGRILRKIENYKNIANRKE